MRSMAECEMPTCIPIAWINRSTRSTSGAPSASARATDDARSPVHALNLDGLPLPEVAVETRSLRLRLQLVASSHLLDYTARSVYLSARKRFRLKVLPVKELSWRRQVSVVYREGSYLSPAARQLIASIKAAAIRRGRD